MLTISWAMDLRDKAGRSRSGCLAGSTETPSSDCSLSMREVSTSNSTNDMIGNTKNARNPRSPMTRAMSSAMTTAVAG